MNKLERFLTENDCYKSNQKFKQVKGVMLHSTATPGATADNFAKSWNTAKPGGRQVCVHAFVDDKNLIQTLPFDRKCWGCGGDGNSYYIQIEICEGSEIYYTNGWKYNTKDEIKTQKWLDTIIPAVVDWTLEVLKQFGINEINEDTVTSHYEGYKKGIASNHGDPAGLFELGGYTMNEFRELCRIRQNSLNSIEGTTEKEENKQDCNCECKCENCECNKKEDVKTFEPYRVKVTTDYLNIRDTPSTSGKIKGGISDYGVYTIVEESGDWGKLKSGAGWVNLRYTRRL